MEDCPYLKYNEGVGEPTKDERGGTDTSQLRSVLLQTMMNEVSEFCKQFSKERQRNEHCHQVWDSYSQIC